MASVFSFEDIMAYYVEESTFGETPATPDMLWIGLWQELTPFTNPRNRKLRGGGKRDLSYIRRGTRAPDLSIKYVPQVSEGITFLDYGITNINKSLSVEILAVLGDTKRSLNYQGMVMNRVRIGIPEDGFVTVITELMGQNFVPAHTPVSTHPDKYATDPGSNPLDSEDCYIEKDATEITYIGDVAITIDNHLIRKPVLRSSNQYLAKYVRKGHRDLFLELVGYFEDDAEIDDIVSDSEFDLKVHLGTKLLTFTNSKWDFRRIPARIEETPTKIRLAATAKGVTLA